MVKKTKKKRNYIECPALREKPSIATCTSNAVSLLGITFMQRRTRPRVTTERMVWVGYSLAGSDLCGESRTGPVK